MTDTPPSWAEGSTLLKFYTKLSFLLCHIPVTIKKDNINFLRFGIVSKCQIEAHRWTAWHSVETMSIWTGLRLTIQSKVEPIVDNPKPALWCSCAGLPPADYCRQQHRSEAPLATRITGGCTSDWRTYIDAPTPPIVATKPQTLAAKLNLPSSHRVSVPWIEYWVMMNLCNNIFSHIVLKAEDSKLRICICIC